MSNSKEQHQKTATRLRSNLNSKILGQETLVDQCLCALFSGGHLLMTGAPGLAKTSLIRVISDQLSLTFGRIQFTPDLLPGDIIGSEILNIDKESGKKSFDFAEGPIFANLILADEINRASPRTQSALLEAMQERQVTVGGTARLLTPPFVVFATQNPFESEGTFPLPEAQLDRFILHSLVDYPTDENEFQILSRHASNTLVYSQNSAIETTTENESFLSPKELIAIITSIQQLPIGDTELHLVRELVSSTRPSHSSCPPELKQKLWYGAGPRAGMAMISAAKALAFFRGQDSVLWQDLKDIAKPALRHRIRLTTHSTSSTKELCAEDEIIQILLKNLQDRHQLSQT